MDTSPDSSHLTTQLSPLAEAPPSGDSPCTPPNDIAEQDQPAGHLGQVNKNKKEGGWKNKFQGSAKQCLTRLENCALKSLLCHRQRQQLGNHSLQTFEKPFSPKHLYCGGKVVTLGWETGSHRLLSSFHVPEFDLCFYSRRPGRGPNTARLL